MGAARTVTAVVCAALLGVATAIAQTPTAEQVELFKRLPPEQQKEVLNQALGAEPALESKPLTLPETSRPKPQGGPAEQQTSMPEMPELRPFGYDVFRNVPTTFAPATDIPVPADYVLGPGDTMEVLLIGEKGARYTLSVGRDGVVGFPQLGPIAVAGMRFPAAQDMIEQRVAEQMIGLRASVSMGSLRSIQVFVLGEAEVNTLLPLLQNILNVTQAGVAAVRGDQLAGFLTGWQMPSFRGKRSIYSPEWANAADLEDSAHIYEEMYSQMSGVWIAEKYIAHYISLFPNDLNALRAWHWMGFGMFAIDAIRGLDPVQGNVMNVDIRRAATHGLEQVMELQDALWQYMMGSPIFLISEKMGQKLL